MPVPASRRRFDVDEYHRMAEAGILSEADRVELIDGEIIALTPIGPRHNAAVDRATRALINAAGDDAIVRVQGSVRLNRFTEPQPDLVLLRPVPDYYASGLPGPADILLIVEIAAGSLEYDRETKGRVYAESGVPEYWLVDLDRRVVLCCLEPHGGAYRRARKARRGEALAPAAPPRRSIAVEALLADEGLVDSTTPDALPECTVAVRDLPAD